MKHSLLAALALMLSVEAGAVSLIKESEAKLPAAVEIKTRAITRGPGVKLVSPDPAATIKSPFTLKVVFEPRGGARIVPDSVRMTYLRTPAVELIDRVKPALSEHGIDLANAEVPPGEHLIQLSLEDSEGRKTTTVIKLSVVK